uniref:Uncharacterized protein n=1 Tax=Romanomermis culicivorax TaxID=13658 RepID=A0A915J8I3_ROMCU
IQQVNRYKINREPEITTEILVDDENNVVQNYRRKSRLTLLEEPPEQFSISTPNGGRGYFEGAMCKCRNGRLRMDSNGDLHCDYCGFTDIANNPPAHNLDAWPNHCPFISRAVNPGAVVR